jgi:hypothetical protein
MAQIWHTLQRSDPFWIGSNVLSHLEQKSIDNYRLSGYTFKNWSNLLGVTDMHIPLLTYNRHYRMRSYFKKVGYITHDNNNIFERH